MLHFFAKRFNELHKEDRKGEKGFTLIELLVVVIIIGILAAIAIPTFLAQRNRAFNADAQTTARNAATAAQTYFVDNNSYTGMDEADLNAIEPTLPATANGGEFSTYTVAPLNSGQSFRITVRHENGTETYTAGPQGVATSP